MVALSFSRLESVEDEIRRALTSDPRFTVVGAAFEIDGGNAVTLSGTVTSYAAKLLAGDAVRRVPAVREVHNQLTVAPAVLDFRADMEIAEAVRHTLQWIAFLSKWRINCVVVDGWVLLTGKVMAEYQKLGAEAAISHMRGVRGIVNDIVIKEEGRN